MTAKKTKTPTVINASKPVDLKAIVARVQAPGPDAPRCHACHNPRDVDSEVPCAACGNKGEPQ